MYTTAEGFHQPFLCVFVVPKCCCIPTRKNIRVCMDKCIQNVRGSDAMASAVLLQWSLPLHKRSCVCMCVY